jgi:putative transposase
MTPFGKKLEIKKSRYTEEQISFALKQVETETAVAEVIRRMGAEQTLYPWKKVYGGLGVGELRRVKQLEDANRKLKQFVADLSMDKHILQDVMEKSSNAWAAARDCRKRPGASLGERVAQLLGVGN